MVAQAIEISTKTGGGMIVTHKWRPVALVTVLVVLVLAPGGYQAGAQQPQTVIRLSHDQPVGHPNTFQLEVFGQLVEQRSKGTIKVVIYPAGQLFSEAN